MTPTSHPELAERLRLLFVEVFGRPFTGNHHSMDTVEEWDSLTHIKLVIAIERTFQTRIDPEDIARLQSFDAILEYLRDQ